MHHKKALAACLTIIMVLLFSTGAMAAGKDVPILLKMNHFYVLYTKPEGPYIDKHNRLMVPARTLCEKLIGANVNYEPKTKVITIKFDGDSLKMTLGSTKYYVNGKSLTMDTIPVLKNGTTLIPLRTIIDAFNIKANWNKEYHYTSLDDDRIMKTELIADILDIIKGPGSNPDAFVPVKFTLETKDLKDSWYWHYVSKLKNVSGEDIKEGREGVQTIFTYDQPMGEGFSYTDLYGKKPVIEKGEILTVKRQLDYVKSNGGDLDLILLLGRKL